MKNPFETRAFLSLVRTILTFPAQQAKLSERRRIYDQHQERLAQIHGPGYVAPDFDTVPWRKRPRKSLADKCVRRLHFQITEAEYATLKRIAACQGKKSVARVLRETIGLLERAHSFQLRETDRIARRNARQVLTAEGSESSPD